MKHVVLALPTFTFVISTRAALAAGIALLVAEKLPPARRRAIGAALVALGASTTLPAVLSVMRSVRQFGGRSPVYHDPRLVGVTRFARKGDDDVV